MTDKKKLESYVWSFTISSCFVLNSALIGNVLIFSFKSELFINKEIPDSLTTFLFSILASSLLFVHLLRSGVVTYLGSISNTFVS